jgi:hypothetical protein
MSLVLSAIVGSIWEFANNGSSRKNRRNFLMAFNLIVLKIMTKIRRTAVADFLFYKESGGSLLIDLAASNNLIL